nr:S8 family peptidase [Micromonospora sp. DSM 115978]
MRSPTGSGRSPARAVQATVAALLATALCLGGGGPAAASEPTGQVLHAGGATAIADSYLVVLRDSAVARTSVPTTASQLAATEGGRVGHVYRSALRGFEVSLGAGAAKRLAAHPAVAYVQQNHRVRLLDTQTNPPSWGLDRIDQESRPLNSAYTYPRTAAGVPVYVIDTGIRFTHGDFGGRAVSGFDAVDGGAADDCNGHGTHVAGTVGGAAHGVAKAVTLIGVRVLDCGGGGTTAGVVAGVDWVTAHHAAGTPAVANMSLGGGGDTAIDDAVRRSIADGVTYSLAAGNESTNACVRSPARVAEGITVGATDINDARAGFSNYGTCVDIFAPGVNITSAWHTSNTAINSIDGTSMAAPHVAGAAALVLAANPTLTPAQVQEELIAAASTGRVGNPGTGSPNRLLYVDSGALRITQFGCEGLRARFLCNVRRHGGVAPVTTQWIVNGSVFSSLTNRSYVSIGCVPGNSVTIAVRISDATGSVVTAGGYARNCPSGNP